MVFGMASVPGRADMVKVELPSTIAAGQQPARDVRGAEQPSGHGRQHEEGHEEADAAVGGAGAGQHHGERRAPRFFVMKAAIVSTAPLSSISLPNNAPSRNSGRNCATN